jgi:hypothetical protein
MESIKSLWETSSPDINPPTVYYLIYQNKYYVVVEDKSSIIYVASKEKNILAVAKLKVKLVEQQGVPIYYIEDTKVSGISPLKIVSCSLNTIKNKTQIFTLEKIVPAILNA